MDRSVAIQVLIAVSSSYVHVVKLIGPPPAMGLFKVERPEIECWTMLEYAALLRAARSHSHAMYIAVCLAGEAGMRNGEVKGLQWQDVDFEASVITIRRQRRNSIEGTPKGRTRRTVLMNGRIIEALKPVRRVGQAYVLKNADGTPMTDDQMKNVTYRLCRKAVIAPRGWHVARHTFATDAARFGVNLMTWMGHKRIDGNVVATETVPEAQVVNF